MRVQVAQETEGRWGEFCGYLKLKNSMLIPLGCKLPQWNMKCCSSSLHVASLWQCRRPSTEASVLEEELKWFATRRFSWLWVTERKCSVNR